MCVGELQAFCFLHHSGNDSEWKTNAQDNQSERKTDVRQTLSSSLTSERPCALSLSLHPFCTSEDKPPHPRLPSHTEREKIRLSFYSFLRLLRFSFGSERLAHVRQLGKIFFSGKVPCLISI